MTGIKNREGWQRQTKKKRKKRGGFQREQKTEAGMNLERAGAAELSSRSKRTKTENFRLGEKKGKGEEGKEQEKSEERPRQSNAKQSKRGNLERDFGRQNQRKHEVLDTQDFDFQLLKLNAIIKARAYYQMLLHLRLVWG